LLCFVNFDDVKQDSLNNELSILHKEYLVSSIDGITSQYEFQDVINKANNEPNEIRPDYINEIKDANPELIDENREWKKNKDIRHNTHSHFTGLMNQTDNRTKSFITEAKKLEFIKKRGFRQYSQLNGLFKYFSQYQHFSPNTIDLVNSNIDDDLVFYQHVIGELSLTFDRLFDVLVLNNKESLKGNLKNLLEKVFNTL
jgi:hypothetical protein